MKIPAILFLTFVFSASFTSAITADIYTSSTCTGTPQSSMTYTLNVCKDASQGGFSMSMKPTVCNATWVSVSIYQNTATCSGSPTSVQTGVPGSCINDSGTYVKITCDSTIPPAIKSGASELTFGLGALFVVIGGILI